MVYNSTQSDELLWYLYLSEKKSYKINPNTKILPIFNGRNENADCPSLYLGFFLVIKIANSENLEV